mmetsp:Transcript_5784/g.10607  ORF Transcript_5784/g.10607 Transcript_5784/m.10607 type:complete len:574 (+) Transcript_5784:65-1786(+)
MADNKPLISEEEEDEDEWDMEAKMAKAEKVMNCVSCQCLPAPCQCPCMCLTFVFVFFLFGAMMTLIGILLLPARYMQILLSLCRSEEDKKRLASDSDTRFADVTYEVQAQTDTFSEMCAGEGLLKNWWFYVKQTHPVLSIFLGDPSHPYRRTDRIVQLFLLQGIAYLSVVIWDRHHLEWDPDGTGNFFGLGYKTCFNMLTSTLPQFIGTEILMTIALKLYRNWQVKNDETRFGDALSNWLSAKMFLDAPRAPDRAGPSLDDLFQHPNQALGDIYEQCWATVGPQLKEGVLILVKLYFGGYMGVLGLLFFAIAMVMDLGLHTTDTGEWKQTYAPHFAIKGYLVSTMVSWCEFFVLSFMKFSAMWVWQHMKIKSASFLGNVSVPVVGKCGIVGNKAAKVKLMDARRLDRIVKMSTEKQIAVSYEEFEAFVKRMAEKERLGHMLPPSFRVSVGDEFEYYVTLSAAKAQELKVFAPFFKPHWVKVRVSGVNGNQISVIPLESSNKDQTEATIVADAVKDGVPKSSLHTNQMLLDDRQIRSTFQSLDSNSDGLLDKADLMMWAGELGSEIKGYRPLKG